MLSSLYRKLRGQAAPSSGTAAKTAGVTGAGWRETLLVACLPPILYVTYGTLGAYLARDDFQWLNDARDLGVMRSFIVTGRAHFYRPVVELWWDATFRVCGTSPVCYHSFELLLHVINSVLVLHLTARVCNAATWRSLRHSPGRSCRRTSKRSSGIFDRSRPRSPRDVVPRRRSPFRLEQTAPHGRVSSGPRAQRRRGTTSRGEHGVTARRCKAASTCDSRGQNFPQ